MLPPTAVTDDTPTRGFLPPQAVGDVSFDWHSHRKYVLMMMFIAYFLNSIDRNIISILQESIKSEFQLMDWQLGIMTGFAFALFYNLIGIPTAPPSTKRAVRTTILAGGMALWSLATAMCGLAQNYWQLLFARAGVGVGEGTFGPAS
jgi:predicted MFS family arabinose efflux permease